MFDLNALKESVIALWFITAAIGFIFWGSYHYEKRKLINGIWFNLYVFFLVITIGITIWYSGLSWLIGITLVLLVGVILILGVLFSLQAIILLWNAWIVWHREGHSLANMLTLLLGIFVIIAPGITEIMRKILPDYLNNFIHFFSGMMIFYVLFWFYNYLTMLVLYQFNRPKYDQDYIIILGSGLLHGDQVSPLLQARINRGLDFYHEQKKRTGKVAKLIFSGGQGEDETIPEGEAMLTYAINHGLSVEDGIAEKKSRTTAENMLFSKRIIEQNGSGKAKTIFVTNNYHTFRAGLYAKSVGLKADGIGAKTSTFFLPNAVMREYIAIFARQKKWHAVMVVFIFLIAILLAWVQTRSGTMQ